MQKLLKVVAKSKQKIELSVAISEITVFKYTWTQ